MQTNAAKFVAYYRVSTAAQGASGLGLEAQQEAVRRFLEGKGWPPIAEFTEVETGKGANAMAKRPQLQAALAYARKHRATLVIAKLDRLARNVAFIANLLESGVEFVAVDNPHANRMMMQLLSVFAEEEARMISERTKAALAAAKARGARLGAYGAIQGPRLAEANKAAALARLEPIADQLRAMKAEGLSVRGIAGKLNADGIASPGGGRWTASNMFKALARLEA
jgi:DNA invertase Pin-like site-specific DNA recombinase